MAATRLLPVVLLSLLLVAPAGADDFAIEAPGQVVAFGDVHGAYDDWVALLGELGVIDEQLNWAGGDTHLVSLGDLVDRGPGSRRVVELLMKLDTQADAAGGAVHLVLGNHEVMVMTGDLRYVSDAEFAAFAADESAAERDAAFEEYLRFNPGADRAVFDDRYPPGFFALRKAYHSDGRLGAWLLGQPFVIKVNDKVYMHGGIAYDASDESLEDINDKLQRELRAFLSDMEELRAAGVMPWHVGYHDRLQFLNAAAERFAAENPGERADWFEPLIAVFDAQEAFVFSDDSPNWYRGTALCHPYAESFNTERFLDRVGAKQLVMGHTPTRGVVMERMGGRAIRLDTGMLKSVYGGRAAALVSGDGADYVHYPGGERGTPEPETRSLAMKLSGMPDDELEDFMRNAEVVPTGDEKAAAGQGRLVRQRRGDSSNDALFNDEDSHPGLENEARYRPRRDDDAERFVHELAAYRLDRMLDLQLVPTAVAANLDGSAGALSDVVSDAISEADRQDEELRFASFCKQEEQNRLRRVFDILIHNEGRSPANTLWSRDGFMLRLIDHSRAFRVRGRRPEQYSRSELQVSDLLRDRLESLDRATLTEALSGYLHPRQIEAILDRRDRMLREAVGPPDAR